MTKTLTKTEKGMTWRATPKQQKFLLCYLDPKSKTWGNAFRSGLEAGYSEEYSRKIMTPALGNQWAQFARDLVRLNPLHLETKLADIIGNEYSKDSDKISAIKLLGQQQGMFTEKKLVGHINVEQALNDLI